VESLLGLKLEVDKLHIEPCIPADWETYKVHYRYRETMYNITIFQISEIGVDSRVTVDGIKNNDKFISLVDDRQIHSIEVKIVKPH